MPVDLISSPGLLIGIGSGVMLFLVLGSVTVLMVYEMRYSPQAVLRKRVAAIANPGDAASADQGAKRINPKRKVVQAKLKELEEQQKKSRKRKPMRQQIQETGMDFTFGQFIAASVVTGLVFGAGAFLASGNVVAPLPAGLLAGWFVPRFVIGYLGRRRQNKFTSLFADAVDVIVRGIQTGLPVGECLNMIGRESPEPVGHEFRLITEGQRLGITLEDALERAVQRMPTSELKFFAIVLHIQKQTGGNLAETLANLSRVLRDRKKMADKIVAMSSEAKSTAMIIGSMPFILAGVLFLMNPDYMMLLFTDIIGNIILGASALMMCTGTFVMKTMMNFKI